MERQGFARLMCHAGFAIHESDVIQVTELLNENGNLISIALLWFFGCGLSHPAYRALFNL